MPSNLVVSKKRFTFEETKTMRIEEISENEFKVFGEFELNTRKKKCVELDGETYYKDYVVQESKKAEDLELFKVELDELNLFGYSPVIWEYSFMYDNLFESQCRLNCNYRLSENKYVAYWQWLYYTKRTPSWIKSVYTDTTDWNLRESISSVCKLRICDYGFNNTLYADVNWRFIFDFENKDKESRHFKRIDEYLSRYGINIYATKESQMINNAIQLLKKQTNATH